MKIFLLLFFFATSILAQNCREWDFRYFPMVDTTLKTLNCLDNGEREGYWVLVKDSTNWANKPSDSYDHYMKWSEGSYKSGKKVGKWLHASMKGCIKKLEKTVVYAENESSTETIYNFDSEVVIHINQEIITDGCIKWYEKQAKVYFVCSDDAICKFYTEDHTFSIETEVIGLDFEIDRFLLGAYDWEMRKAASNEFIFRNKN
ncbi:MAG: hypothetical protein AB8B69_23130 [Chitinophagales bacterium]